MADNRADTRVSMRTPLARVKGLGAAGPAAFDTVQWFFGSPIGILFLFGYTWILMHHMLGGVRHLVWDFGHGMEPGQRINMARFTLIGSIALTVLIWAVAFLAF